MTEKINFEIYQCENCKGKYGVEIGTKKPRCPYGCD